MISKQNWNMFASSLIIETCRRWGSKAFFVSPGYRDAPFIAALQEQNDLQLTSCWDERAAAYQALGWAKASGKPAVLLCTSGTAGANYLPAIIEAKVDHVPLLVITADRPFDLVHAGAQQVIDQRELFGRHVKKSFDFPCPAPSLNAASWISYTRLLLECASSENPGPVHINLPFAAPLDPIEEEAGPSSAIIAQAEALFARQAPTFAKFVSLSQDALDALRQDCHEAQRGLLLIGRLEGHEEREAVRTIRDRLGWPLFADIGSGLKFESQFEILDLNIPASRKLLDAYRPDCVLHIGRRLVSRFFDDGLQRWQPARYWVLSHEENIQDPYHLPQRRQMSVGWKELAAALMEPFPARPAWQEMLELKKTLMNLRTASFNFADVAQELALHCRQPLFLANSTAIRAFDSWTYAGGKLRVEANRGVSGIEGLLATSIGLALGSGEAWTLVVGDVALMHDLNSIMSLAQSPAEVTMVVVNNSGGRIFETLPLQKYAWVKDPLISTPHDFHFEGIASMAGLPYARVETREAFVEIYRKMEGRSCVIECVQSADADLNYLKIAKEVTHG